MIKERNCCGTLEGSAHRSTCKMSGSEARLNYMERYGEFEQVNGCVANRLQDEVVRLDQELQNLRSRPTKVIANDVLREIVEEAHMAGQADAGVDPGDSNARAYYDSLFSST